MRRRQPPPPCGSTASRLCHVPVSVRTPQREADGRSGGTVTFPPAHPQPRGRSGSDGLRVWTPIVFAQRRFDAVPAFPPRVGVRTDGDRRVVAELICSTASMSRAMYATWQRPTTRQGRWTVSPCLLACGRPYGRGPKLTRPRAVGRRPSSGRCNRTPPRPALRERRLEAEPGAPDRLGVAPRVDRIERRLDRDGSNASHTFIALGPGPSRSAHTSARSGMRSRPRSMKSSRMRRTVSLPQAATRSAWACQEH